MPGFHCRDAWRGIGSVGKMKRSVGFGRLTARYSELLGFTWRLILFMIDRLEFPPSRTLPVAYRMAVPRLVFLAGSPDVTALAQRLMRRSGFVTNEICYPAFLSGS